MLHKITRYTLQCYTRSQFTQCYTQDHTLHNVTMLQDHTLHNVTQCYTQDHTLHNVTHKITRYTMLHNVTHKITQDHTTLHNVTHLLNDPLYIRLIEESQRCQVDIELGCAPHVHWVDSIRTERVVTDCKDTIITSEVKESGKAQVDCMNDTVDYWVAFHCGVEELGRRGEREEEREKGRERRGEERMRGMRGRRREEHTEVPHPTYNLLSSMQAKYTDSTHT